MRLLLHFAPPGISPSNPLCLVSVVSPVRSQDPPEPLFDAQNVLLVGFTSILHAPSPLNPLSLQASAGQQGTSRKPEAKSGVDGNMETSFTLVIQASAPPVL